MSFSARSRKAAQRSSDRPHRPALAVSETVEEMRRCAGTQFDPLVVEALLAELGAGAGPAE